MRRAWLQAMGGVAGDMFLAALISAGVPEAELANFLACLPGRLILRTERVTVSGLSALRVRLSAEDSGALPPRFSEFMALLDRLELKAGLREKARKIFELIFSAEARVHGKAPSEVNLHELSAYDTLGDVLGVLYGLHHLGISELYASPLPLGSGLLETVHGRLPHPAPAAAEILRGVPVYGVPEEMETVTPTGAALVRVLARDFGPMPPLRLETVGLGAGTFTLKTRPNILRLFVGAPEPAISSEEVVEIVCDLDDESPEVLARVAERLLSEGALDAGFLPRTMKRGRPGVRLEALVRPEDVERLSALILEETSTLGVRLRRTERRVLSRRVETVETPYGPVRVKVARTPSGAEKIKPEYRDLARLSEKTGIPLRRLSEEVKATFKGVKMEISPVKEQQNE